MFRSFHCALTVPSGYLKSYIVLPSCVWGVARNPLVDAGLINPHSMGLRFLFGAALARGRAGVVGKGAVLWSSVEIEESMCIASSLCV